MGEPVCGGWDWTNLGATRHTLSHNAVVTARGGKLGSQGRCACGQGLMDGLHGVHGYKGMECKKGKQRQTLCFVY